MSQNCKNYGLLYKHNIVPCLFPRRMEKQIMFNGYNKTCKHGIFISFRWIDPNRWHTFQLPESNDSTKVAVRNGCQIRNVTFETLSDPYTDRSLRFQAICEFAAHQEKEGRSHEDFVRIFALNNPITERVPRLAPGFHSFLSGHPRFRHE